MQAQQKGCKIEIQHAVTADCAMTAGVIVVVLSLSGFSRGFPDIVGSPAGLYVERLNLLSCPWGLAQEFKAGVYARIIREAFNIDAATQFIPAIFFFQPGKHHFQRHSM